MKQYSKIKISIWVVTVLWMTVIFYFSHQPADISKYESGKVLVKMNLMTEDDINVQGDKRIFNLQLFIRKTAHVTVFLVLGILMTLSIHNTKLSNLKSYMSAYISGSLYGIFDEVHQMFIPGRGPQLRDVLLDSAGVLIGVLITALLIELIRYINSRPIEKAAH